jgi:hypothetical protein
MSARRAVLIWAVAVSIVGLIVLVAPRTQFAQFDPARLERFASTWFTFEYPAAWHVISEAEQCGLHGPAVFAVVGTGDFDLGGTVTPNSASCPIDAVWTVPADGVVVAFRADPICCLMPPAPRPALAVGQQFDEVGSLEAVRTARDDGATWFVYSLGPEYIEARWGEETGFQTRAQVQALIASWEWLPAESD